MSHHGQRVVPPIVNVGKYERLVDPSSLTPHQKQALWTGIKTDNPALADMLLTDAGIADLKQKMNATVRFAVDDFNSYLQTGLKTLEEKKS